MSKKILILFVILCGLVLLSKFSEGQTPNPNGTPQPVIVSTLSDTLFITWEPQPDPDTLHYNVYIARRNNQGVWDTTKVTVPDTFMAYPKKDITEGLYVFGVSALDPSGNESGITWGNDCDDPNQNECWYLTFDVTPPAPVMNIKPKNRR